MPFCIYFRILIILHKLIYSYEKMFLFPYSKASFLIIILATIITILMKLFISRVAEWYHILFFEWIEQLTFIAIKILFKGSCGASTPNSTNKHTAIITGNISLPWNIVTISPLQPYNFVHIQGNHRYIQGILILKR